MELSVLNYNPSDFPADSIPGGFTPTWKDARSCSHRGATITLLLMLLLFVCLFIRCLLLLALSPLRVLRVASLLQTPDTRITGWKHTNVDNLQAECYSVAAMAPPPRRDETPSSCREPIKKHRRLFFICLPLCSCLPPVHKRILTERKKPFPHKILASAITWQQLWARAAV